MPKAVESSSTITSTPSSRRCTLFAAVGAVMMGSGIAAGAAASVADFAETPDAELIRLCAEFDVLERRRQHAANNAHTMEEDDLADLVWEDVSRQQRPILNRICNLPCVTLAGLGALAASLMLWDSGELAIAEDDTDAPANDRLTAALLRSTLAGRA